MDSTMIAPMTETTMLSTLMPVGSLSFRRMPASQPPTIAPTIPRMIVPSSPSRPPTSRFARKPAIAPSTIQLIMPMSPFLPGGSTRSESIEQNDSPQDQDDNPTGELATAWVAALDHRLSFIESHERAPPEVRLGFETSGRPGLLSRRHRG